MSKEILFDVLGQREGRELWTNVYRPVLPVTPQDFSLGAVLPVIMYMMRWGHRRGQGKWEATFQQATGSASAPVTVARVADLLTYHRQWFHGFEGPAEQAVMGDMLLAFCLENKGHRTGRGEQVQRAFPTHYFGSWIDLPKNAANLRNVPEMITAILTQPQNGGGGYYELRGGFDRNLLLRQFGMGTSISGQADNIRSDIFDESSPVGLDQLLTIRLAMSIGEAPVKVRGESAELSRQLPLASQAAAAFYEDLNVFLRAYGEIIPRQSLLPMIECCFALGLTNLFGATLRLMLEWAEDGRVTPGDSQASWPLFADCSASADLELRRFAEASMDDLMRRLERMPVCWMCLRILEQQARHEDPKALPPAEPDATARVEYLGDLLHDRLEISRDIERDLRKLCNKLSTALEEQDEYSYSPLLTARDTHPAWRLAETIVTMMGDRLQGYHLRKFFDSCLLVDAPNGLARKRRISKHGRTKKERGQVEQRSLVLTDTVLDYLVHRHLRRAARGVRERELSLRDFIDILRARYGFFVDVAPPGLPVPAEALIKNRAFLERRLRDLGLFMGVNDAEAMKRLRPRFTAPDSPRNAPTSVNEEGPIRNATVTA